MAVIDWLTRLLFASGLPPHGYCLLWDPMLVWTHVVADALTATAYFSIPFALAILVLRRRDLQFGWMLWLFVAFILLCGTTHAISILVLWVPAYGLEGVVKAITAAVSVAAAIALWPLLPRLVALPSPAQLAQVNDELRREAAERERTEAMLRQSQKMEALGQLTSGIAHDFNNLLTVIAGNLDRLERRAGLDDGARRNLANALAAAERAAGLTTQLLTFARKHPGLVAAVDLNLAVAEAHAMFARTLPPGIALSVEAADGLPPVRVDRNQLSSALLNLALNAVDAMPEGGALVLSTARAADGRVVVAVRDTGSGMDPQVAERATEPFFTTKPVGRGSGLGLSQVYGFVTQAGGEMEIVSAPGTGTDVRLYFPDGG